MLRGYKIPQLTMLVSGKREYSVILEDYPPVKLLSGELLGV